MRERLYTVIHNRKSFVFPILAAYLFYFAIIVTMPADSFLQRIFWLLGGLVVGEILLRILLLYIYGRKWRYGLYNYYLVDDPVYGYNFRPSIDSKTISFPVFDKFVFKPGKRASLDPVKNAQDRTNFNTNSKGYRGPEFEPKKEPGVTRIFASGGSTTACNSVDDSETWPSVLARELKKSGKNVEVINAGVQGWDAYQELRRFEEEIVNYDPDIVLLHQGWNDEFAYTSQNLGKWWSPHMLRDVIEKKYFCCKRHPIIAGTWSALLFFVMRTYFTDYVFKKNMNFLNFSRWECLKSGRYIEAWFDVMIEFARIADKRGIKLYVIDYLGLVNMSDSNEDRETVVENSRLTHLFAHYQAVSKARTEKTLSAASKIIPLLDANTPLDNLPIKKRLELFTDEIHMTQKGNQLLGREIAKALCEDQELETVGKSNVLIDERVISHERASVGQNLPYVDRFIDGVIDKLKNTKSDSSLEVPPQRYTTF